MALNLYMSMYMFRKELLGVIAVILGQNPTIPLK